jgi:hypothetical protein
MESREKDQIRQLVFFQLALMLHHLKDIIGDFAAVGYRPLVKELQSVAKQGKNVFAVYVLHL